MNQFGAMWLITARPHFGGCSRERSTCVKHILQLFDAGSWGRSTTCPNFFCLGAGDAVWRDLDDWILKAATRLIQEHETYASSVHDENVRRQRRSSGSPEVLPVLRPEAWGLDSGFDPYLVRSRRTRIAHSIRASLKNGTYEPRPPAGFSVPKPGGGERLISTFQIADEVISNHVLRSLTRKNLPKISARAYAYRPDLTPHDAISYVTAELSREHRVFVAEYDFSKFFDTVRHEYIFEAADRLQIAMSPLERNIVERFIVAPEPYVAIGDKGARESRSIGIPQGTSLSLFLANLAASELDRSLERLGVGFVRYADDTLIWSADYGKICAAADALHEASEKIGSPVNVSKSHGIRLLTKEESTQVEMKSTDSVDYLGHNVGLRTVRIKGASVERIKRRIEKLIYTNLILEPLNGTQDPARLTDVDRDYIVLIWQLRRYLYGSLTEKEIRRFQEGVIPPMTFEGVMSYFPLVEDHTQLVGLDSWMATQIWLALRKRGRLLSAAGLPIPAPHNMAREHLLNFRTQSATPRTSVDLRVPSFRRMAGVLRRAVSTHGLSVVTGRAPLYLYED